MNAKNILSATVAAFAFVAAAPAMASTMGDADPGYPAAAATTAASTVSRAEVKAQRAQAAATGFQVMGEAFVFAEPVGEALTRAQVRAETLEAIRVGAISRSERYEFPTAQQLESIRTAGLRAVDPNVAASAAPKLN